MTSGDKQRITARLLGYTIDAHNILSPTGEVVMTVFQYVKDKDIVNVDLSHWLVTRHMELTYGIKPSEVTHYPTYAERKRDK